MKCAVVFCAMRVNAGNQQYGVRARVRRRVWLIEYGVDREVDSADKTCGGGGD